MSELTHNFKPIILLGILILILGACSVGPKENKPSPYGIDSTQIDQTKLSIKYSSPGVKKRKIWGDLVPYGNMWRTGANEATVFSCDKDIKLAGNVLPSGKYSIFTIPDSHKWTIIFNSEWIQWGAYNYDENQDALRLEIEPKTVKDFQERMKFSFESKKLKFHWEYLQFEIDIETLN
ncbi:MAG: hypothetical protein ACJA08_001963 [Cyclobacteriaceae bacterium]|jgi:hypothetical protein